MTRFDMFRLTKDTSPGEESQSSTSSGNTSSSHSSGASSSRVMSLEDEFKILKTLGEGSFAKILLAKKGSEKMALKAIHCEVTTEEDFTRELELNYFLSPHPNIITSFNVSFVWDNCFVFVQEFAPFGDLARFVKKGGLSESQVKAVAHQLSTALEFMHSLNLVHRDLKLENILVFKSNLSLIKLCDFGNTRAAGTLVRKTKQTWIPFAPPEISSLVLQEKYYANKATDVWQMGIILYVCLTGSVPWDVADITDLSFCQYTDWLRRKSFRLPESFKSFTPRLVRLFKRILEPKPTHRYEIREVSKYLEDDWLKRRSHYGTSNSLERKESMKTSHSSNNKHKSLHATMYSTSRQKSSRLLRNYGLETEVDKNLISERLSNWVSSSKNKSIHLEPSKV